MPLTMAAIGEVNRIRKITGQDETRQHLAELGFVVGEPVRVVNELGGNLIVWVKDSRVALNRAMAMRVLV
ncbi:MAG: ferrous iron transport protein A [Clostridiales bacterium]|nr:ferrous iron transport protein A [Clostridiales bacterium]